MTQEQDLLSLAKAFEVFTQTTTDLQDYYGKLEHQAQHLTRELEKKNEELNRKVLELDETRSYLNNILESITDGVIAVDLKGRITTCNKAALSLVQYNSASLIGKRIDLLLVENQLFEFIEPDRLKIHINKSGIETMIEPSNGKRVPIILFASLIFNDASQVIGAVFTFKDLSLIKKLEDEVERSHRLASIGELAAGVAHEIRNPLGGIEMFTSILNREFEEDHAKKEMTGRILEGVRSINRIVSELLNFTRSFNRTKFRDMDIVEVVEAALVFAEVELEDRQVKVVKHYGANQEFYIQGDQDQLKQLFLNLFLNAAQAMTKEQGGELYLDIKRNKHDIVVRVCDTGRGIANENIARVFDPFFTTRPDGNGLGLAISHRIVEAHKGKISVRSKENRGATFTIKFPAVLVSEV